MVMILLVIIILNRLQYVGEITAFQEIDTLTGYDLFKILIENYVEVTDHSSL